jgi:hypothetical protein
MAKQEYCLNIFTCSVTELSEQTFEIVGVEIDGAATF